MLQFREKGGVMWFLLLSVVSAVPTRELCTDSCQFSAYLRDGICDDGTIGAQFSICPCGSDCTDCGPKQCACPELELVEEVECPDESNLLHCGSFGLEPGDLCEGDGECGTNPTADNCGQLVDGNTAMFDIYVVQAGPTTAPVMLERPESKKKKNSGSHVVTAIVVALAVILCIGLAIITALYCFSKAKLKQSKQEREGPDDEDSEHVIEIVDTQDAQVKANAMT